MTDFLAGTTNSEPVRSASRDADSVGALGTLGARGALERPAGTNEPQYLEQHAEARDGWRLVAVYHLLRAAEIVAEYTEHGSTDSLFDPVEQAELHFDRARDASTEAGGADLYWFGGAYHGDGITIARKMQHNGRT